MKIPKKFKLHGHTITVEYSNDMRDEDDAVGKASYRAQKIILQPICVGYNRTRTSIEHTFLHELTHHILNEMAEHDMMNNEKFVDLFSALLHQALTTMEYK